jgi:hypothetical protein
VRRTTTHDSLRPDGLLGDVRLTARGRDLRTERDGTATVLGTATLAATIRFVPDRDPSITQIRPTADLGARRGAGLVRLPPGARRRCRGGDSHSLRFQLLDDVPTATLVSGCTIGAGGVHPPRSRSLSCSHNADLCAGWATGATILTEMATSGIRPS